MPNEPKHHSIVALLSLIPLVQFTCSLPLNTEVKKRGEREVEVVMY
jgi:hypothetical protein